MTPKQAAKPGKSRAKAAPRGKSSKSPAGTSARSIGKKSPAKTSISPVIPYLTVRDANASLAFYERAFGFKRGGILSLPDGSLIQVAMRHQGVVAFKFSPEGACSGSMKAPATSKVENPVVLYVPCRNVDNLAARARSAGATIASEPEDMFWGERITRIVDPDGYVWCFAAKRGEFDATRIPPVVEQSPSLMPADTPQPVTEPEAPVMEGSSLDFEL